MSAPRRRHRCFRLLRCEGFGCHWHLCSIKSVYTEDLLGPQRRACQRTLANPKLETLHVMCPEHRAGGAQWRSRQYTPKPRSKYDTRPQRGGPAGPSGRGPRRGGRGAGGGLMQDAEDSEEDDNNRFGQRGGLDGWGEEDDKPREWVPPLLHPSSACRCSRSTAQHPSVMNTDASSLERTARRH